MANEDITGTSWTDAEVDLIVADYFAMLEADLARQPYVKAHHNEALRELIGRSRGSVEYKHQNISAVLLELGMPWLSGYKPAANYQNSLVDGVDRYLSAHSALMERPGPAYRAESTNTDVFVAPPTLTAGSQKTPRLNQLIRKFDPVERDRLNRALGRAGEEFVLEVEKAQLARADLYRLARNVRWISKEEGDGAGWSKRLTARRRRRSSSHVMSITPPRPAPAIGASTASIAFQRSRAFSRSRRPCKTL